MEAYRRAFDRAAEYGLGIMADAGELTSAETVRTAVLDLHATRIGHGICSIDDPGTVDLLIDKEVLLEVCLTSNLHSRVVNTLADHPFDRLAKAGVWVSINSDDPGISAITLTHEYGLVNRLYGYDREALSMLNRRAMLKAFTSEGTRASVQARLIASPPQQNRA